MDNSRDAFNTADEFRANCEGAEAPSKIGNPDYAVTYRGCLIPVPYKFTLHKLPFFEARKDDTCIMSFPKTGQTMTAAVVSMIKANGNPEVLHTGAPLKLKVPYLEMAFPRQGHWQSPIFPIDYLEQISGPRIYGTHLNANAVPAGILDTAQVVYVYRNPKDTIVSLFHFIRSGHRARGFHGTLSDVVDMVLHDRVSFAPYFEHLEGIMKNRHRANIFITSYEKIIKNPREEEKRLAWFLGKDLSEASISSVVHHCSFLEMKRNKNTNMSEFQTLGYVDMKISPFMRSGTVGDWKNHLTVHQNERIDAWVRTNLQLRPSLVALDFDYE